MQDAEAEAEADEEEQQEHGDMEADGEAEDAAAHAGGQTERETGNPGKVQTVYSVHKHSSLEDEDATAQVLILMLAMEAVGSTPHLIEFI